MGYCRL